MELDNLIYSLVQISSIGAKSLKIELFIQHIDDKKLICLSVVNVWSSPLKDNEWLYSEDRNYLYINNQEIWH